VIQAALKLIPNKSVSSILQPQQQQIQTTAAAAEQEQARRRSAQQLAVMGNSDKLTLTVTGYKGGNLSIKSIKIRGLCGEKYYQFTLW
jgi:hypothetical protein